ncbi:MAG: TolC family protein [Ginsengibacter sp.]
MYYLTKWLNSMVKMMVVFFILLFGTKAHAQEIRHLTLEEVNEMTRRNYPMIKQKDLIKQSGNLNTANLNKGYLPQFTLSGQASYQSDVTQVNVPIAGFKIEPPGRDQYKVLADVSQLIYDGGIIRQQNKSVQLNAAVDQQKVEVALYQVKQQVDQLYLAILYLDAQIKQVSLVEDDLNVGIKNVTAQVQNGIAFRSNLNVLKAQLLQTQQRIIELTASRRGVVGTLALFINAPLGNNVVFEEPVINQNIGDPEIHRPEITLYAYQDKLINHQTKMIKARNQPRASLFMEGGYGRPSLNVLKNQFDFFYIGGIRLNWSLSGLYTRKQDNELVDVNKRTIDIEKETFLLNTKTQLQQQQADIDKMNLLIASDEDIITLRGSIKEAAQVQLKNGVITVNDYLREVNDEDQARQALITHRVQLLQAQINYQIISGK